MHDPKKLQTYDQGYADLIVGYANRLIKFKAEQEAVQIQINRMYKYLRKIGIDSKALREAIYHRRNRYQGKMIGERPEALSGLAQEYLEILETIDLEVLEADALREQRALKGVSKGRPGAKRKTFGR